jgi:hypothetical protein
MFMCDIRSGKLIALLPNVPTAQRELERVATWRQNVTLNRRRRAEITTTPIVCQKECKGCVSYNGAEVSSRLRFLYGGGGM